MVNHPSMDILLTFTGFHDPYSKGLVGEEELAGPILSLLSVRSFNRIFLFGTPGTRENTTETASVIQQKYPCVGVETKDLALPDPTDYAAIFGELRPAVRKILNRYPAAGYFIAVASGTPQMHACWVLMTVRGELPARILQVRPPKFVTSKAPMVSEVDLSTVALSRDERPQAEFEPEELVCFPMVAHYELALEPRSIQEICAELGLIGDDPAFRRILKSAAYLACAEVPVLILGETGTGKELVAKFIHHLSARCHGPFVPINCAAIPAELMESQFFGHKKGAFTGAVSDFKGKFDQADGGTLFLDELGELPPAMQAKLLRVLEDKMVETLGDKKPHPVNVRIIAATNTDLKRAIEEKRFRKDLYFRLNVGELRLPPLRARRGDISTIALAFLERINRQMKQPRTLSQDALQALQNRKWPGNIRELENVIERSVLLSKAETIDAAGLQFLEPDDQGDDFSFLPEPKEGFSLETFLSSAREQLIRRALELSSGNQSQAARLLGVSAQAISKAVKTFGSASQ